MPRTARIVVPGFPHHVTQRGIRRAEVFLDDDDRRFYLATLHKYAVDHGVAIWAYCLMANHVHFVMVPATEGALGRTFHDAHGVYSMRFNQRNGLDGHVFQGRFYSTVMDEAHLWAAVRYIERNPVRAGIVEYAQAYPWSSARAHCDGIADTLLAGNFPPEGVVEDWIAWLREEDEEATETVRKKTRTGRPCGSMEFMKRLESILGRIVSPQKPGPKPKKRSSS